MRTIHYNGNDLKVTQPSDGFVFGSDLQEDDDGTLVMGGGSKFERWSPHAADPNMPAELRQALNGFVAMMDQKYGKGKHEFSLPKYQKTA
jgi:hypothetical protein